MTFSKTIFGSVGIEFELPSVQLVWAEAAIGSYTGTPIVSSSPLGLVPAEAREG